MMKKPSVTAESLLQEALAFRKAVGAVSPATILVSELAGLLSKDSKPSKAELLLQGMRIKIYIQSVTDRLYKISQPEEFLELSQLFNILAQLEIFAETI